MNVPLQPALGLRIFEHDPPQRPPIQLPRTVKNPIPPPRAKGGLDRRIRVRLAHMLVRCQHQAAHLAQEFSDRALAAADAPGQPDDRFSCKHARPLPSSWTGNPQARILPDSCTSPSSSPRATRPGASPTDGRDVAGGAKRAPLNPSELG